MSTDTGNEPRKKHRHDLGQEDHGPIVSVGTTRAIQSILGLWILLTFSLVGWAMIDAGRTAGSEAPRPAPADRAAH